MPPALNAEAKAQLAEKVVLIGLLGALKDIDALAEETGLTTTQIRKQLAENRYNVRRQLLGAAQNLGAGGKE